MFRIFFSTFFFLNLGRGGNFGNDIFGILGNFGISGSSGNGGNGGSSVGIDETISPTAPVTLSIVSVTPPTTSPTASVTPPIVSFAILPISSPNPILF